MSTLRYGFALTRQLTLILVLALAVMPIAWAHKGHAGKMVEFMELKPTVKQLLPDNVKVTERKQEISKDDETWVKTQLKANAVPGMHTFYLAKDSSSNAVVAGVFIKGVPFHHGEIKLAIGLNKQNKISGVVIMATNEKYVDDVKNGIGSGLVDKFKGMSLEQLLSEAATSREGKTAKDVVLNGLADAGTTLAALIHGVK